MITNVVKDMRNMRTDECYLQTFFDAKSLAEQCETEPDFEEKRKRKEAFSR